jgi:heme-degrading monooxygenase HmoA
MSTILPNTCAPSSCARGAGGLWFPWEPGPEEETDQAVVVSLTEFTMHSLRSLPGIVRSGARLRSGWYGLPGAVGLYLWADPLTRSVGSVSVWTDQLALRRWVRLPLHQAIMRRYGPHGTLRSALWKDDAFDRHAIVAEARRRLAGGDYA